MEFTSPTTFQNTDRTNIKTDMEFTSPQKPYYISKFKCILRKGI